MGEQIQPHTLAAFRQQAVLLEMQALIEKLTKVCKAVQEERP